MKRKILSVIMSMVLVLSLAACGDKAAENVEGENAISGVSTSVSISETDSEPVVSKETEAEPGEKDESVLAERLSMAIGSALEIEVPNNEMISEVSVQDSSVISAVEDSSLYFKTLVANKAGETSVIVKTMKGNIYKYPVKVFDQRPLFSPDYVGINTQNYLEKLGEVKKQREAVLDCDRISFTFDFFKGENVTGGHPVEFDVNFLDLLEGEFELKIEGTKVEDADWYSVGISTAWEDWGGYLNLDRFERYFSDEDMCEIIDVDAETADTLREIGRLWINGNGYCLDSVTLTGTPSKNYEGITATANSPVIKNGVLKMDGTNVVNDKGEVFRLLGTSFGWNTLTLQYGNARTYASFNELWGGNCVRVQQTVENEEGYATVDREEPEGRGNKEIILYYLYRNIDACIESGMYAVVDWHCYYNPVTTSDYAIDFFEKISARYAGVPNVIYEIMNEPCDDPNTRETEDTWENCKEYADIVIPIIRKNSPDALIVCGGPCWSNDLISRADDPLSYDNIIYTDHVYDWHTHFSDEEYANEKGLGLFITETSIAVEKLEVTKEAKKRFQKWEEMWNKNNTGWIYFVLMNLNGTQGLKQESVKRYGWTEDDYTDEGIFMYHMMRRAAGLE